MDMRKYATGVIKPEDLYEGPLLEKIINVSEHEKFGCPVLQLESGDQFYCWNNHVRVLNKAWGYDSENWIGQELELSLGHYLDKKTETQKETINIRAVSPPKPAIVAGALPSRRADMDDDIPFAPEWR